MTGLLDDTPARDYALKLRRFNEFAQAELRRAIGTLSLTPGMRVLDVGCGSGEALAWFHESVSGGGLVAGIDVATAHVTAARAISPTDVVIVQADLMQPPFANEIFDLVWCVNTINHLKDPIAGLAALKKVLRPGGRIALGQTGFLPDMFLAWDSRLERLVTEGVRQYYRDRYNVSERDLAGMRGLFGLLKRAGFRDVTAQTFPIERVFPLAPTDAAYLVDVIFRETRGERLKPYLSDEDLGQLMRLQDPSHPDFALKREDFHFLQTFSLVVGRA